MLIKRVGAARWRYLQVLQVGQRCQSGRSQVTDIVVTQVPETKPKRERRVALVSMLHVPCVQHNMVNTHNLMDEPHVMKTHERQATQSRPTHKLTRVTGATQQ